VESTSAARPFYKPGPIDQSSLCNIDHFLDFETQDAVTGAFRSGAVLRRAIEITDDPVTTGVANRSRHLREGGAWPARRQF
jgi:hypothetical protein